MKRRALDVLNRLLRRSNLRLDTLTAARAEARRLADLAQRGHFDKPVYGALPPHLLTDPTQLLDLIAADAPTFAKFAASELNDVGYSFDNAYFSSPDTEVLYTIIGLHRPKTVIEIGSGNSTRVMRQAVMDHALETRIVSVDPDPRVEIAAYADEVHQANVETLEADAIAGRLGVGDILFIDSSHIMAVGGDVAFLYFEVLPRLRPGVLVHIHDIFLPYEYPQDWVRHLGIAFDEQLLLNGILQWSDALEIIWPGYLLQKSDPRFAACFPYGNGRRAQSFWVHKQH
jgi:predicted O-methyltransferase YrrM